MAQRYIWSTANEPGIVRHDGAGRRIVDCLGSDTGSFPIVAKQREWTSKSGTVARHLG